MKGADVLEDVRKYQPDLILLDLMLPDRDGFEICEQLNRNRETNLIPVIMVTSLNDPNHRLSGVRVGANGYLTKPFTPHQLFEAIQSALTWHDEHTNKGTTGEINFDVRSASWRICSRPTTCSPDLYRHTPLSESGRSRTSSRP